MRVYRSICTYIWNDDKFPFASDDCQLVWFHIFTNPLSSPLGIFRASMAGLAEDKNRNGRWSAERYRLGFQEAIAYGFLKYDEKALLVSFPKYFSLDHSCNHPGSINVVKSWGTRFNDLPDSPLKLECYQSLLALLEAIDDGKHHGKLEAFHLAFERPSGMARAIPDPNPNPNPEPNPEPEPEPQRGKRIRVAATSKVVAAAPSSATWSAYATAYRIRYGVEPVRNQQVNSLLCTLVKKLGADEAPAVAAFYVTHNKPFYVERRHPVNLLVQEAEGLRTQWATGTKATRREADSAAMRDELSEQHKRVTESIERRTHEHS